MVKLLADVESKAVERPKFPEPLFSESELPAMTYVPWVVRLPLPSVVNESIDVARPKAASTTIEPPLPLVVDKLMVVALMAPLVVMLP